MQSRMRWLFFWIAILSVVLMAARVPLDTDMWWHIKAGEISLANHQPLMTDVFSYTRSGISWINHSWLAEIILALLYNGLGYYGLTLFVVVLAVIPFILLYFMMEGHPFLKAIFVIIGAALVSPVWSPRPQLFTLVGLAILVFMIDRYRKGRIKRLWAVPVLFAIWGNLHGGYFTGLLYLFFLLIGILYERLLHGKPEDDILLQNRHILLVTGISIPALLVNANGFNILKIPFSTVGVDILRNFIDEWASPDFHQPLLLIFLVVFLAFMFLLAANKEKFSADQLVPMFGFAVLAFYAKRNIAPFMIVMLPLFSHAFIIWLKETGLPPMFTGLIEPAQYNWSMRDDVPLFMKLTNGVLVFLFACVVAGKFVYVSYPAVVEAYLGQQIPVQAYSEAEQLPRSGHLLNEYGWGGYQLMMYPDMPVFVDGRTDLFGDEIIGQWMALIRAEGDYAVVLDRYDIDAVLLQPQRPLVRVLEDEGWHIKYQDNLAVLLSRPVN